MNPDSFERRRKRRLVFGVLVAGAIVSALVAVMLFLMGSAHPHI